MARDFEGLDALALDGRWSRPLNDGLLPLRRGPAE
jgi:hypothetical protein